MNAHSATTAAFDPAYFSELARVEDRHFWFRARNRLIAGIAREAVRQLDHGYRVLEVGCGNGNVLRHLSEACPGGLTVGMDFFSEGLHLARRRTSSPLVQGDARRPPFGRPFHLIGMFDVLEHIEDDLRMLRDGYSLLEPGGVFVVTVPAGKALWSYFDEASHHCRRYETGELRHRMQLAGFEVQRITPFMCSLYPLLWLTRQFQTHSGPAAHEDPSVRALREFKIVPVVNEFLYAILSLEAHWIARGGTLPFGTSLLAVARRPSA